MTKILPLLTAMYTIMCSRRLQSPRDNCAVRVQWLSSVRNTIRVSNTDLKFLSLLIGSTLISISQSNQQS